MTEDVIAKSHITDESLDVGEVVAWFRHKGQEHHARVYLKRDMTSGEILLQMKLLTESLIQTMARVGALTE